MAYILNLIGDWKKRFGPLLDKSAWLLIAPALAAIFLVDPALGKTLVMWTLFALVLSGIAVVISRIIFPQIDLALLMKQVDEEKNAAAAIVASSVIVFVALIMIALVVWAKT